MQDELDAVLVVSVALNAFLMVGGFIFWRWSSDVQEEVQHHRAVASFWMSACDRKESDIHQLEREISLLRDLIKRRWGNAYKNEDQN